MSANYDFSSILLESRHTQWCTRNSQRIKQSFLVDMFAHYVSTPLWFSIVSNKFQAYTVIHSRHLALNLNAGVIAGLGVTVLLVAVALLSVAMWRRSLMSFTTPPLSIRILLLLFFM